MQVLEKIKLRCFHARVLRSLLLFGFLLLAGGASGAAYYSTSGPIDSSPARSCTVAGCSGVTTGLSTSIGTLGVTARIELPILGSARARYQLNGTALAGYRGGVLLAPNGTLVGLNTLPTATIRTYLSSSATPNKVLDQMVVSASALKTQLVAANGLPAQLELIATTAFDQVEIEFSSVASLGSTVYVLYAYGVGPNMAAQITGLTSNSATSTPGLAAASGDCADKVSNPTNAVDSDLTNYATFSSLASVFCTARLTVGLNGTAPGTYKAGFVIGQDNNLLDAGVLSSLVLKTYKNGVLQETGTGASLLSLSVLPDNKSLVTFQATQPFDAVSIERSDAVAALDNLRLYYGVGVASTSPQQTLSSFADPTGHYKTFSNGVACVNCSVTSPANAAGSPNSRATVNTLAGAANSAGIQLDLNGTGNAGNRAGMVLGNGTVLDVAALNRLTLVTYDAAGNVLETASGSSVVSVTVLPDGRQTVSFNTTKNFAKVGLIVNDLLGVSTNTDVYYAFSDSSNGSLRIVAPTSPLPVTLTSFTAKRQSAGVVLNWATASEVNSARFVVERTTDLVAGFSAIGSVAAAGSSSTARTYALQDPEAASLAGTLYYRLRQIDLDGRAHVSAVVVVAARAASTAFALYPNPATAATQQVTLDGTVAAGYSVSLYSGMGQLLSTRVVSSEAAAAPVVVPTAGLAAGVYQVVLRDAAGQRLTTQRLQVTGQ